MVEGYAESYTKAQWGQRLHIHSWMGAHFAVRSLYERMSQVLDLPGMHENEALCELIRNETDKFGKRIAKKINSLPAYES